MVLQSVTIQQALSCHQAGDFVQAEVLYCQLLAADAGNTAAGYYLGLLKYQTADHEKAIELMQKVVARKPNFVEAHYNLGVIYAGRQRFREAADSYEKALALKPAYPEALNNLGLMYKELGWIDKAYDCYRQSLVIHPGNVETLVNISLLHRESGRLEDASASCREALAVQPDNVAALNSLGLVRRDQGNLTEAVGCFQSALGVMPESPDILNNLGSVLLKMGKLDEAGGLFEKALAIRPEYGEACNNLGLVRKDQERLEEAESCYRQALGVRPDYVEALNNLGILLRDAGREEEAMAAYRQALAIVPDSPEVLNNLGNLVKERDIGEAAACYRKSLAANPEYVEALNNLGLVMREQGNFNEAVRLFQKALAVHPDHPETYLHFATTLNVLTVSWEGVADPVLKANVTACLRRNDIKHQDLVSVAIGLLMQSHGYRALHSWLDRPGGAAVKFWEDPLLSNFVQDSMLLLLLEKTILNNSFIERILSTLRMTLLRHYCQNTLTEDDCRILMDFLGGIACQCFCTEYVYDMTSWEMEEVDKLRERLTSDDCIADSLSMARLALLGSYVALHTIPSVAQRAADLDLGQFPPVKRLVSMQITAPLYERCLVGQFPLLSSITDDVSCKVQNQYEENPYPRWFSFYRPRPISFGELLRLEISPNRLQEPAILLQPDILIAGCGTGKQPISTAIRVKNCTLLAVDLSLASLAYARRKAEEFGISNISFMQGDILELKRLQKTFDIIECAGVLHHMDDPEKGWRVLVDLLKDGGFMKIGLYSEDARQSITAAREFIAGKGFTATVEGIRKCRQEIFRQPEGSLLRDQGLTESFDFYSVSGTRDLIFHVHEQRFTIPRIADFLHAAGLRFLGFIFENPVIKKKYLERFPDDKSADNLQNWERFEQENLATFSEMYQFWCYKKE